jgi:hypothetical protein
MCTRSEQNRRENIKNKKKYVAVQGSSSFWEKGKGLRSSLKERKIRR